MQLKSGKKELETGKTEKEYVSSSPLQRMKPNCKRDASTQRLKQLVREGYPHINPSHVSNRMKRSDKIYNF